MPRTTLTDTEPAVLRVVVDEDPTTAPERRVRAEYLHTSDLAEVLTLDPANAAEISAALAAGVPYHDLLGECERTYLIPSSAVGQPLEPELPATPLRVIHPNEAPIEMTEASVAQILDGLSGAPLHAVWEVLIATLEEGHGEEDRDSDWRAFFVDQDQEYMLARQLRDYREQIAAKDPSLAAELVDAEDGLEPYLSEQVEIGYCTTASGEGGQWCTDYVRVPAGLDEQAKEQAAMRAAEAEIAARGEQSVAHVFIYCLSVARD